VAQNLSFRMTPEEDVVAVRKALKRIEEIRRWDPFASASFVNSGESFAKTKEFLTLNQLRAIRKIHDRVVPIPPGRADEG
jgi:hypothetical protein